MTRIDRGGESKGNVGAERERRAAGQRANGRGAARPAKSEQSTRRTLSAKSSDTHSNCATNASIIPKSECFVGDEACFGGYVHGKVEDANREERRQRS